MKALFTLKSAIDQSMMLAIAALLALIPVIYPKISYAASSVQTQGNTGALVFEIKNSVQTEIQNPKNQSSLTSQTIVPSDPLAGLLQSYLESYNSPLAPYASQIITLDNWKKALAISYVESHMGEYCADNNCSGIGGSPDSPTWKSYPTKLDWFIDLNNLLNEPLYSQQYPTCQAMKGVYVQPGSDAWVDGCQTIYSQLTALEDEAAQMSASQTSTTTASGTITIANVTIQAQ